jgi:DNA-binding ferritin-like protein
MNDQDFRDYQLLLDEQPGQIFAMTGDVGGRAHKIDGTGLRSISDISEHHCLKNENEEPVVSNADE